ncbi:MAG TPA: DMT family transporter [Opitutaceae bacterium]
MLAAFLTTLFFSLSAIFANRSISAVGRVHANLGRLAVALLLLGAYAHLFGGGLGGAGRNWFLISGVIGMGLGDLATFSALPLIGSRLTVLITQCVAVPVAMLAERAWLGTQLTGAQMTWATVILAGVAFALMPSKSSPPRVPLKAGGFVLGLCAAAGQGLGAVASRKANELTALAGQPIDGITAAYQRIVGGFVLTALYFAIQSRLQRRRALAVTRPMTADALPLPVARPAWRAYRWCIFNALCGAVLGVSCYQWSLATTPSGIVLPIVACTPLVIVPLAYWIEHERPTRRSLAGGALAVTGVIALTLAR